MGVFNRPVDLWCRHCDRRTRSLVYVNRDAWDCLVCGGLTTGIDEHEHRKRVP